MKELIKLTAVLLLFAFFDSCNKEEIPLKTMEDPAENINEPSAQKSMVYLPEEKMIFKVDDKSEIKRLVKKVADEKENIQIKSSRFTTLKDSRGEYKAVTAKYEAGDKLISLVIPLVQPEDLSFEKEGATVYLVDECTMKCTSAWMCDSCKQVIHERCKSQTCTCESGSGGCSSKISFP